LFEPPCSAATMTWPPTSTWKDGDAEACSCQDLSARGLDLARLSAGLSYCTAIWAIVPSREIEPGAAYGDETETTSGSVRSCAINPSMRVCTAAVRMPAGALI